VGKGWGKGVDGVSGTSIKIVKGNEREKSEITAVEEDGNNAP
jgi:hypothetical protein